MRELILSSLATLREVLATQGVDLPPALEPYLAAGMVFGGVMGIITLAAVYAGLFIYFERRVAGRIMSRIGPNRVGPHGLLQWIADAVKLMFKEDIIPSQADRTLFKLAPYLMAIGVMSGFAVLPLSPRLIGANLNIGIVYVLAITSISVVGILMSGWASNSKWALFGGMRSAAQIVSYEIPVGLAVLPAVMLSGSMGTQDIIANQGGMPWDWHLFHSPMMMVLFIVYFISSLAEGSRTPFDLPEAESELVSGYNTEYSGFRFAAYFLAEFANTWIAAALGTIVFLGGWQIPFASVDSLELASGWGLGREFLAVAVFAIKTLTLVFVIIQLRWTLPRVRVDQMMTLCWKYLVPIAFACTMLMLVWMVIFPWDAGYSRIPRILMVGLGAGVVFLYVRRVAYNLKEANAPLDLNFAA